MLIVFVDRMYYFIIQRLSRSLPVFADQSKSPVDLSRETSFADVPMRAHSPDDTRRPAFTTRSPTSIPSITHKIPPENLHTRSQPTLHESLHDSQRVMAPALDNSYTSTSRNIGRDMLPAPNSWSTERHDGAAIIAQKWRAQSGQMVEMRHELDLLRMQNANLKQSLTLERMQS